MKIEEVLVESACVFQETVQSYRPMAGSLLLWIAQSSNHVYPVKLVNSGTLCLPLYLPLSMT